MSVPFRRGLCVLMAAACLAVAGCHFWGSPHADRGPRGYYDPSQRNSRQDEEPKHSLFGSMFAPAEPQQPKSPTDFVGQDRLWP